MLEETEDGQRRSEEHRRSQEHTETTGLLQSGKALNCSRSPPSLLKSEMNRVCQCFTTQEDGSVVRPTRTIQHSFSSFTTMGKLVLGKLPQLSLAFLAFDEFCPALTCPSFLSFPFSIFSLRIKLSCSVRNIGKPR